MINGEIDAPWLLAAILARLMIPRKDPSPRTGQFQPLWYSDITSQANDEWNI